MKCLGIFARLPQAGRTKTRLAADIGDAAAAEIYSGFLQDLLPRCEHLADAVTVAVTPESAQTRDWFTKLLPANGQLAFQTEGNLGDRIIAFFDQQLQQPADICVLIGSDSPDLPGHLLTAAFSALAHSDIVLGPATDGGFVLVGLRSAPGTLFDRVRWSQPTTLLDVINAARQLNRTVTLLPPWYDVDSVENLGTLLALQLHTADGPYQAAACPQTVAALQRCWPPGTDALSSRQP